MTLKQKINTYIKNDNKRINYTMEIIWGFLTEIELVAGLLYLAYLADKYSL